LRNAAREQLLGDSVGANLVQLVERDQRFALLRGFDSSLFEQRGQDLPMVEPHDEVIETKTREDLRDSRENLCFDDWRRRADGIEIALGKLAEATVCRPVGAPHRLHLIPLEKRWQKVLILRDDARER